MVAGETPSARQLLLGRERECDRLDELLRDARAGRAGCVLLVGEPGIGKTALLGYAAERARDMRVLRARGLEREADIAYAGLLELFRPVTAEIAELPHAHAVALEGALALSPSASSERIAVAAGVLGLVASLAEDTPTLLLVDDAHWLDHASRDALLFAARRLKADQVAVLLAAREGEGRPVEPSEKIVVAGLARDAALELLAQHAPALDRAVGEHLWALTRGNPLALRELPATLSREQLLGQVPLPEPLPTAVSLEAAFARRAHALGDASWRALVLVSASASGRLGPMTVGLRRLALDDTALEAAVEIGLVTLGAGRVEFCHPLMRSAIYQAATLSERHAAHRALADALAGADEDERAWHLAAAAIGADETAATALAAAGTRSRRRGGNAEAAAAFERAAGLSVDPLRRNARLFEAASAAWLSGRTEKARSLLDQVSNVTDGSLRAEILALKGHIEHFVGEASTAQHLLLEAGRLIESTDPHRAIAVLGDACECALMAGDAQASLTIAQRMEAVLTDDSPPVERFLTVLAIGCTLTVTGAHQAGLARLNRAVDMTQDGDLDTPDSPYMAWYCTPAWWTFRAHDGRALVARALAEAQRDGAAVAVPELLWFRGRWELSAGRWTNAEAAASEGAELAREFGQTRVACACLMLLATLAAARGNTNGCRSHVTEAAELASRAQFSFSFYVPFGERALGLLELGAGDLEHASRRLEALTVTLGSLVNVPDLDPVADLVESLVRQRRLAEARTALERAPRTFRWLDETTRLRCQGLIAAENDFEPYFRSALAHHHENEEIFEQARTRLCFGERLLRSTRRREGREELRHALATFERLAALPWAERAEQELGASGRRRRVDRADRAELSSRELQIAVKVAEGLSNREVGAALFLSAKTVEYHLTSIFRKLEIHSRAELIRHYATVTTPEAPAATSKARSPT